MASVKFLEERISKAQETINKKQNTIEKKYKLIEKKKASLVKMGIDPESDKYEHQDNNEAFWTMCDISHLYEDIERGSKEIEEKKASLEKYQQELEKELHKANSRNVKIIIDFLDAWKKQNIAYYEDHVDCYLEALADYQKANSDFCDWWNNHYVRNEVSAEEFKQRNAEDRERRKAFKEKWSWMAFYMDKDQLDMAKLQKDLDEEANRKYDFIIARTEEIVTEITDASYLSISGGQLNGFIIGTTGRASVNTIGAGGYNIQRFHFRTLVKELA